jgi:hypothetical protein
MASIQDLPLELLIDIASYLQFPHLCNFRLASKLCNSASAHQFLSARFYRTKLPILLEYSDLEHAKQLPQIRPNPSQTSLYIAPARWTFDPYTSPVVETLADLIQTLRCTSITVGRPHLDEWPCTRLQRRSARLAPVPNPYSISHSLEHFLNTLQISLAAIQTLDTFGLVGISVANSSSSRLSDRNFFEIELHLGTGECKSLESFIEHPVAFLQVLFDAAFPS